MSLRGTSSSTEAISAVSSLLPVHRRHRMHARCCRGAYARTAGFCRLVAQVCAAISGRRLGRAFLQMGHHKQLRLWQLGQWCPHAHLRCGLAIVLAERRSTVVRRAGVRDARSPRRRCSVASCGPVDILPAFRGGRRTTATPPGNSFRLLTRSSRRSDFRRFPDCRESCGDTVVVCGTDRIQLGGCGQKGHRTGWRYRRFGMHCRCCGRSTLRRTAGCGCIRLQSSPERPPRVLDAFRRRRAVWLSDDLYDVRLHRRDPGTERTGAITSAAFTFPKKRLAQILKCPILVFSSLCN